MAQTWEQQVTELDKKHGNPAFYLIEKFEVMDDVSLVDRAANRQDFMAVKADDNEDEGGINVLAEDEIARVTEEALREADEEEKADSLARRVVKAIIPRLRNKDAPTEGAKADATPAPEDSPTVKALQAELAESRKQIQALEERYAQAEKSAERDYLEREIDGFIREGKVLPKTKDFLMAALTGENFTMKAEGGDRELTPKEALLQFLRESQPVVPFGEKTAAADKEDYGKFNGKSAAEYAAEQMSLAGRKPKA